MLTIDPRYFKTVGLSLQRGRDFTDEDGMAGREPAAIINQRFAALHFPGTDPIGRRIKLSITASRTLSACSCVIWAPSQVLRWRPLPL